MSYCPECGSEVANNDVFCAYCGISLPNVSAVQESVSEDQPDKEQANDIIPVEFTQNEDLPKIETPVDFEDDSLPSKPSILKENEFDTQSPVKFNETPLPETGFSDELILIKKENDPIEYEQIQDEISETAAAESNPVIDEEKVDSAETSSVLDQKESNNTAEISESNSEISIINQPTKAPSEFMADSGSDNSIEKTDLPINPLENREPTQIEELVSEFTNKDKSEEQVSITTGSDISEKDEDERLKSVLDEIDLNLQSQNENPTPYKNEVEQNEGVVITTAANLQQEFIPQKSDEDEIITPSANYGDSIQNETPLVNETPIDNEAVFEPAPLSNSGIADQEEQKVNSFEGDSQIEYKEIDDEPATLLSNEINVIKPIEDNVSNPLEVDHENKEQRSFTNPIIGGGDTDNRSKTKLKPLDEGTVLNSRYEIVRKIGGGGMGAVYLATDKNLGGVLRAVKEMVQSYIEDEQQEKAVNDFKRESLLLTSLEHPAIPTIFDYFFDDKEARFYLVMKYISGGDLAARLRSAPEGRIDEVSVTDWAIQVTDVLDYLHNRQPPIVYRDLKPSNIMIDGNTGKLMLIDFGIARWVNSKEEKGVTAVGTMGYAPPELFSGNVEPRSDIYSLGSTMFHLLTGADPQSNPLLIFDFNKNPKPRQINSQLSDQMEQILMRAVEYNSTQRFNSALEMKQELIRHMENLKKGTVTFGVVNTSAGSPISASVPVFCGFCGQKIVATDMFCPFCGAQQPLAAQSRKLVPTPPAYSSPVLFPRLVIIGTSDLESTDYVLEKESNLLGRRDPMSNIFPEVDLSKFDPQTKISRKHARIWREGDVYMLEDLGSSNGTVLSSSINGSIRLLPRQPHVLSHGDKVKLGDTTLRFTVG